MEKLLHPELWNVKQLKLYNDLYDSLIAKKVVYMKCDKCGEIGYLEIKGLLNKIDMDIFTIHSISINNYTKQFWRIYIKGCPQCVGHMHIDSYQLENYVDDLLTKGDLCLKI